MSAGISAKTQIMLGNCDQFRFKETVSRDIINFFDMTVLVPLTVTEFLSCASQGIEGLMPAELGKKVVPLKNA